MVTLLLRLLDDADDVVRDEAYRTLSVTAGRAGSVQDAICGSGALEQLLGKTTSEAPQRVVSSLRHPGLTASPPFPAPDLKTVPIAPCFTRRSLAPRSARCSRCGPASRG